MGIWNVKEMTKEWKKIDVPKKYDRMRCDFNVLESHDITMNLSIREDSGKTTQALLYALMFYKLYDFRTVYLRSDENQITRSNIEGLFETIIKYNYVSIIFDDKYNDVYYDWQNHRFYLCKITTVDGEPVVEKSKDIFMYVCCNENYMKYKSSGFTDPRLNFMIYDEFMDTNRATSRQMTELMNNISTFGRPKTRTYKHEQTGEVLPMFRALLLGNNTNLYSFWFTEFCIEDDIANLKFGSYIDKKTLMGTTFACHLIATSNELKETVKKSKVHFFGFDTPKMNAFNGLQEWQTDVSQHILYDNQVNDSTLLNWFYISHRNKYAKVCLYKHNKLGIYVFIHYSNTPKDNDKIVLTLYPQELNHVYGFGEYHPCVDLSGVISCFKCNMVYYASNSVGEFIRNYITEYKTNKLF